MVRVEFWSSDERAPHGELVATVIADGAAQPRVEGTRPAAVDLDDEILSVTTGRPITWREDAEGWARSLPAAYRGPYLLALITHDDDAPDGHDETDEPLVIRQRVRH
jgi:hypothetical protein